MDLDWDAQLRRDIHATRFLRAPQPRAREKTRDRRRKVKKYSGKKSQFGTTTRHVRSSARILPHAGMDHDLLLSGGLFRSNNPPWHATQDLYTTDPTQETCPRLCSCTATNLQHLAQVDHTEFMPPEIETAK